MANNYFDNLAFYLLAYSGTGTIDGWRESIIKVYENIGNKSDISVAKERVARMVMYWCIEVGTTYKAPLAYSKFRKCYVWEDFRESFSDSENFLVNEWLKMKEHDNKITERRKALACLPSIPVDRVEHDAESREALRILVNECTRRHDSKTAQGNIPIFRMLISIYTGHPFIILGTSPDPGWPIGAPICSKKNIPNLLTSYWLEDALDRFFGDALLSMKNAFINDRKRNNDI
jgi:hypothetical protein